MVFRGSEVQGPLEWRARAISTIILAPGDDLSVDVTLSSVTTLATVAVVGRTDTERSVRRTERVAAYQGHDRGREALRCTGTSDFWTCIPGMNPPTPPRLLPRNIPYSQQPLDCTDAAFGTPPPRMRNPRGWPCELAVMVDGGRPANLNAWELNAVRSRGHLAP